MINGFAHRQRTNLLISNRKVSANAAVDIAEHPVEPGCHISNLINNTLVNIVGYGVSVSYEGGDYNRHGAMMMLMMMMMGIMVAGFGSDAGDDDAHVINLQSEHG